MSYMSDRTILPRLQEHLLSNQEKTYIDLNLVSDELQQKYKEYAKRKRSAFRASVGKAYSIILQRHGLEDVQGYEREIIVKNPLVDTSNQFLDNLINRQLTDLYSSNLNQQENAFIPISSDEAENTTPITKITAVARGSVVQETSSLFNRAGSNKNSLNGNEIDNHNKQPPGNIRVKKNKLKISDTPIGKINRKRKKSVGIVHNSTYSFKNIGGMAKTLEEICKIILHMRCPEIYKTIGVSPPRGLLLHGPPGCGKTLLANAIAGELNVPILKVSAPELVAGVSGESEERIRELFDQAVELQPCVLFIDEIDVITPSRDNAQKEMERRIVAQLVSCLDDLNENNNLVFVMGASNRLDSIDKALRRAGRFDREISLGFPDTQARTKILKTLSTNLRLTENFDFETIALYTPGFVGADLLSLIREAAMVAINRSVNMYQNHKLNEVASEMGINVTTDEIIKNNEINDNESLNINKVNAQSNSEPITNTLCTKDTSTEINVTDIPDPTKMVDLQNVSFNFFNR
ncbi:hypothetical protein NQ317_016460 [Molorchus minor]|uniref:AAA+ ATPase domain-containing protein n=1 Tax=Molorchus minor TaxID=1323400 RepID=A0ABQ9K2Y5_9CUCU|nr:hypothetical protein NQ317_016460 [Molorchus minor]